MKCEIELTRRDGKRRARILNLRAHLFEGKTEDRFNLIQLQATAYIFRRRSIIRHFLQ